VTATYNGAPTLRSTLAGLCAQEFTDFEAWIVGDASTDDSAEVVASMRDDRLHWVNLAVNSGNQSVPNNEGLRRARGRYIAYLGHDDLWFPWHLGALVDAMQQTGAGFAHGMMAILEPDGVAGVFGEPPDGLTFARHFVPPSSWMHTRQAAEAAGFWAAPDAIGVGVDLDYARRLLSTGVRVVSVPRLTVLKFPSPRFRLYAPDALRPQAAWLARMQADPLEVERETLTAIARLLARSAASPSPPPSSDIAYLRQALRTVARRRLREPLATRWPFSAIERWRFHRARRRIRAARGLPPAGG
jgi:glycosyltransferase involved in cell wall biosynthesis